MASTIKNLSTFSSGDLPDITSKKFGLVVSEWNDEITHALMSGALETLLKYGAKKENIIIRSVPGSFELTLGAQTLAQDQNIDAILCLGCVIQGETPHFDFICNAVARHYHFKPKISQTYCLWCLNYPHTTTSHRPIRR